MEDFNLFKGTGIGFEDLWDGNDVISEVGLEKSLNKEGLLSSLHAPYRSPSVFPVGVPRYSK